MVVVGAPPFNINVFNKLAPLLTYSLVNWFLPNWVVLARSIVVLDPFFLVTPNWKIKKTNLGVKIIPISIFPTFSPALILTLSSKFNDFWVSS